MNYRIVTILVVLVALASPAYCSGQTTAVNLTVLNTPPVVSKPAASSFVSLNANSTTEVWCNTTVTEYNGLWDLSSVSAALWNPDNTTVDSDYNPLNHYSPTLTISSNDSIIAVDYMYLFSLYDNTLPGAWNCRVTAADSQGTVAYSTTNLTVYSISCSNIIMDSDEELTDCGGPCHICLTGEDVRFIAIAGESGEGYATVKSYTPDSIGVTGVTATNLTKNVNETISSGNIIASPSQFTLESYGSNSVVVKVLTPDNLSDGAYNGSLTFNTNTTVELVVDLVVDVRSERMYLNYTVNSNLTDGRVLSERLCVNNTAIITVFNLETNESIDDAIVELKANDTVVLTARTNKNGTVYYKPDQETIYDVRVTASGYHGLVKSYNAVVCERPSCDDGIMNQGEEDMDCGGPCPPCMTCDDGIMNQGEEDMDCGGPCPPCHCFNGLQDGDELGIDCGGSCPFCPDLSFIPVLRVSMVEEALVNQEVRIRVIDRRGDPTNALIKVTRPDGNTITLKTDLDGIASFNASLQGTWTVMATKAGHVPARVEVSITEPLLPTLTKASSYLIPLILLIIVVLYIRRLRLHTAADRGAVLELIESGEIEEHRRIYTLSEVYNELSDRTNKLSKADLTDSELDAAEELAIEHGTTLDDTRVLVLCDKIKAGTLLTTHDYPDELRDKYKRKKTKIRRLTTDEQTSMHDT